MNEATMQKFVNVTPPAAIVDDASLTTAIIDTLGFRYCQILVTLGATDIALTALKVQESDADDMTGAADVTGLVFGATGATALPSATDDNKIYAFNIDLRGRKRYLDVVATVGNGTAGGFATVLAILSKAEEAPNSVTERGLGGEQTV